MFRMAEQPGHPCRHAIPTQQRPGDLRPVRRPALVPNRAHGGHRHRRRMGWILGLRHVPVGDRSLQPDLVPAKRAGSGAGRRAVLPYSVLESIGCVWHAQSDQMCGRDLYPSARPATPTTGRNSPTLTTPLDTDVAKRKPSSTGDETKARIIEATLETLKTEGIVGTSARAIARTGDFNQALIFYHFGSVDDAVIASVGRMSEQRLENHREKLKVASSLPDLIRIARELHDHDKANCNMTVLAQAFAGAAGDAEMGPKLYSELEPWSQMVGETIERVVADMPGAGTVPTEHIANAVSAMFLGIEMLDDLDASRNHAGQLFDSLESLASLLDDLLATPLLEMFLPEPG